MIWTLFIAGCCTAIFCSIAACGSKAPAQAIGSGLGAAAGATMAIFAVAVQRGLI